MELLGKYTSSNNWYCELEMNKSNFESVFECFNTFNISKEKNKRYSRKISEIDEDRSNKLLVEDNTNIIEKVIHDTSEFLKTLGIETINSAHIELHQIISDSETEVEDSFCSHNDGEVGYDIISVLYYLSRDFSGGELVIYDSPEEESICQTIDVRSSSEDKIKIVLLDNDVWHSINNVYGVGERNLLAVFIALKK